MTFDRHRIAAAIARGGIVLRPWQRQALIAATANGALSWGLIVAIMGAGKSIVLALLACAWTGRVVVSTSSVALVEQIRPLIARLSGEPVGAYYTGAKDVQRITVVCTPSMPALGVALGPCNDLLWIADEAHKAEVVSADRFLESARPVHAIGMTATPYRADTGLRRWQWEVIRYGIDDAIQSGALVPFRVDFPTGQGKHGVDDLVIDWMRARKGAPGVVSAADIEDADNFALRCCDEGLRVAAVHSRMRTRDVNTVLARLREGALDAVVHCHMLSEGVDLPWLRWLALRQGRGSRVEYAQEIGRVLRAAPDKDHALVFDPWHVTLTHNIQSPIDVETALTEREQPKAADPVLPSVDPVTGEEFEWDELPPAEQKRVTLASPAVAYIGRCVIALRTGGVVGGSSQKGRWRHDPATPKQIEVLTKMVKSVAWARSEAHRLPGRSGMDDTDRLIALCRAYDRAFKAYSDSGYPPRKGVCSDLITCMFTLVSGRSDVALPADTPTDPRLRERAVRSAAFGALARYGVDPTDLLNPS